MHKNWRGGGELLLKNGTINGYVNQPCNSRGRIHIARSPWHFGDYCNIFLPNFGKNQKKSYHLSAGPLLTLCHMVILALVSGRSSKFWWGDDKIYKHKLCIYYNVKFWMFMISIADIIFSGFRSDLPKKRSSQFNELILPANGWLLFLL